MWKTIDSVLFYIPVNFKYNKSLAIFNFINTLIKPIKNGHPFELKYRYKTTKEKLLEIHNNGASICIFQSFSEPDESIIKDLFTLLIDDINIDIMAFFTLRKNKYAKPFTNTWNLIRLIYSKNKRTINKNTSIMVGHKAGRISVHGRKIDNSCIDRSFANNIGISFCTPCSFFLKPEKINLWQYSTDILNQEDRHILISNEVTPPNISNAITSMESEKFIVIVTGPPSCGKTTLSEQIKRKYNNENIENPITSLPISDMKFLSDIENAIDSELKNGKKIYN